MTKGYFVPEVDKRIAASGKDFKIEWTQAYSFTLANFHEVLEAVEEGIADVGVQIHVFEESKLPLENISTYVPFGTANVHALTQVMRDVRKKVPEMEKTWADSQPGLSGLWYQRHDSPNDQVSSQAL